MSDANANEVAAMAIYGKEMVEALQGPSDLHEVNTELFEEVADFVKEDLGHEYDEHMMEGVDLTIKIIHDVIQVGLSAYKEHGDNELRDAMMGPAVIALAYLADTIPLFEYYLKGVATYGPKLVIEKDTKRADDPLPEDVKDFFKEALGDDLYDTLVDNVTNMTDEEINIAFKEATS